jgi:Rrf2 family protein
MLGITRQTDYAARVVLHLSCLEPGARVTIAQIARQRLLPVAYVRRVMQRLVKAGLLITTRGMKGGVRLARPASEISLLDVVRAVEGHVVLNRCVDNPKACPLAATCPVQRAWTQATRSLEATLATVRFDQLATHLERGVTGRGYGRQQLLKKALARRRAGEP